MHWYDGIKRGIASLMVAVVVVVVVVVLVTVVYIVVLTLVAVHVPQLMYTDKSAVGWIQRFLINLCI